MPGVAVPTQITTPAGAASIGVSAGATLTAFSTATPQVPAPAGINFPFGQLSFSATTAPGALVTFTVTLPQVATDYYKLVNGAWQLFPWDGETGAKIAANALSVTIRDNGRGDSNSTLGVATDPGAPAVAAAATSVSTTVVTTTVVLASSPVGGIGSDPVDPATPSGFPSSGFPSSGSGGTTTLVVTGSSPMPLIVWGILLLVFGRIAVLLSRPLKVIQRETR